MIHFVLYIVSTWSSEEWKLYFLIHTCFIIYIYIKLFANKDSFICDSFKEIFDLISLLLLFLIDDNNKTANKKTFFYFILVKRSEKKDNVLITFICKKKKFGIRKYIFINEICKKN